MAAVTKESDERVTWLTESIDVLDASASPLELAGALIDLGALTVERGDLEGARRLLDQGLTLASASKADAVRLLYELLDKLDAGKREVFVLAELEQLAAPQIAEALGINLNTVYSRLRLARETFNQALARHHVRDGTTR